MKILLLTPMPPDRTAPGAIPAVLHAQLVGLAQRHEVVIVTIAGPDGRELAAVERLAHDGIEVHVARRHEPTASQRRAWSRRRVATWARTDWPWRTVSFWAPGLQTIVDELVARRGFDVVTAEDSAMAVYRLPAHIPRVYTEHEVRDLGWAPGAPDAPRGIPEWIAKQVNWRRWDAHQRQLWGSFDVVQTFTDRDAEAIKARLGGHGPAVRVTPFGIDLPERADAPEQRDQLVFVGNYTHSPNVDAALWLGREILPRLRQQRPGATLALAGMFPPPAVRNLEGDGVRVLGQVDDVDALTRGAALVCAPVRIGGGMRMKVLQGMALGKAVLTTTLGTEGLATGGRVAPLAVGDDADTLASIAGELLADDDRRRRLGADARRFAQRHHDPSAYAARLASSYEHAVELHRPDRA